MALNQTGITKQSFTTPKSILISPETAVALSVVVGNTDVSADAEGKKIIKAGTPLKGSFEARNTAFVVATADEGETADANAVALHDIDVTSGNANGTALAMGVVNLNNVDTATQALLTTEIKNAFKHILFVK